MVERHIEYLENRCAKRLISLRKSVANRKPQNNCAYCFFKLIPTRSIIDYGCLGYGSATISILQVVHQIQIKSLKILLGLLP